MESLVKICFVICVSTLVKGELLQLFPTGKQLSYTWNANFQTGTAMPEPMDSSWQFNATLIVQQTADNYTALKIVDIKTSESRLIIEPISLPFQAYYENGLLSKFYTEESDKQWSVNIKRALVTLLQLNLIHIKKLAFSNDESGLYGTCKVHYLVSKNYPKNIFNARKILDKQSCLNVKESMWSSAPKFVCSTNYQKELLSHSERLYTLNLDGEALISEIKTKGEISLQPYQSLAEAHYSLVTQSLKLEKVEDITNHIYADGHPSNRSETELIWEPVNLDPTYGKPPTNKTAVINEILQMLGETTDSLSSWEVGVQGLNNETLFRLVDLMWWLDVDDWETLYSTVTLGTSYRQETIQQIFWKLVPEVGSSASVLFIKDLIVKNKVKESHAILLLVNLPFKLRNPTEELLVQCEDLLRLGDVAVDVKNSAVLAFASLIQKTCSVSCKPDLLDRYTKIYLDRFQDSALHADRMLYLQGLSNIELPQILDYMRPLISGQDSQDRHLRFLATWTIKSAVSTNPNQVYDLFWPLLTNRTEPLELRVSFLTMLILAKPTPASLISLFWYMQTEPSQQLYLFYYTTIHSLTQTQYPCYSHLRSIAAHLSRFVHPRSNIWATGNYVLDYEEPDRGYGGLLQIIVMASEKTGLPNIVMAAAEQHSLGISTEYDIYIKIEGLGETMKNIFSNTSDVNHTMSKVFQELKKISAPVKRSDDIHIELILKLDNKVVYSAYLNETNYQNVTATIRRFSSIYFDFSVNYQWLKFPLEIIKQQANDFGVTALSQVRKVTFVSARGRVSHDNVAGNAAELDLRYTWHGVTSLRSFSPLSNTWYGADRSRSLHIRLPLAVQIYNSYLKNNTKNHYIKITAIRHGDFPAGSRLGGVWHTMTRIISGENCKNNALNTSDEWSMDSEDLGARLGVSVFDCQGVNNLRDTLHLLKRAFLAKNKNYHLVPGGVALLGLLSLSEQLSFQPPGGSCGVMLSFVPLLNQVEPVLLLEKNKLKLSMTRKDGLLWEMVAGIKKLQDGNREIAFKLYHTPSISVSAGGIWRVIQFEGAFMIPSRKSGVFQPPAPLTGYTYVSWGDALPSNSEKTAVVDLKIIPGNNESHNSLCVDFKPSCLQTFTDLATRQTVRVQYLNLPVWLKTAAHALFPENFQTESISTEFAFNSPVPFPWNSKGLCAISDDSVLSLDNATIMAQLSEHYTVAVADCSAESEFSILVKKISTDSILGAKILSGDDEIELFPSKSKNQKFDLKLNGRMLPETEFTDMAPFNNDTSLHLVILKKDSGMIEVELKNGVVFQHYSSTVVFLIPAAFRGYTCGLCGDYNSDTNNDQPLKHYYYYDL